jgi:hypothetical protein
MVSETQSMQGGSEEEEEVDAREWIESRAGTASPRVEEEGGGA